MGVVVVIIAIVATLVYPVFLYLLLNGVGSRKGAARRRQAREGLLTRLNFAEVERRTGYRVPPLLKEFYASSVFLDLDGFHFSGGSYSSGRAQLLWLAHFLPLNGEMLDQCKLPDSTWLPFAQDERGAVFFLPLSEFHADDGPVYRIDPSPPPWKRVNEERLRRVSDSLRRILEQGTRTAIRQ